jgi:hypothetical protein
VCVCYLKFCGGCNVRRQSRIVRGIDWVTCHDIFIYVPDSELVLTDEHGRPVKASAQDSEGVESSLTVSQLVNMSQVGIVMVYAKVAGYVRKTTFQSIKNIFRQSYAGQSLCDSDGEL